VVKSLVEMHEGTISVRSGGLNQGTEFCIRLPTLSRSEAPLLRHQQATPSEARRILVVDDNVEAARMLALLLAKMGGHEVRVAHDGPGALETGASFEPHLVLLDIGLPSMSGYEVAAQMRQHSVFSRALLVALTGYGTQEDRRKSQAAGFHEHLVKPPTFESLQRLLEHPKLGQ
jgi:CheY-like chemotaxis protein